VDVAKIFSFTLPVLATKSQNQLIKNSQKNSAEPLIDGRYDAHYGLNSDIARCLRWAINGRSTSQHSKRETYTRKWKLLECSAERWTLSS
jgi:hypothetical protein